MKSGMDIIAKGLYEILKKRYVRPLFVCKRGLVMGELSHPLHTTKSKKRLISELIDKRKTV